MSLWPLCGHAKTTTSDRNTDFARTKDKGQRIYFTHSISLTVYQSWSKEEGRKRKRILLIMHEKHYLNIKALILDKQSYKLESTGACMLERSVSLKR